MSKTPIAIIDDNGLFAFKKGWVYGAALVALSSIGGQFFLIIDQNREQDKQISTLTQRIDQGMELRKRLEDQLKAYVKDRETLSADVVRLQVQVTNLIEVSRETNNLVRDLVRTKRAALEE
jgi:proline racemase